MSADPCLSQSSVSSDGKWEGWCWYPDRPQERAVVEVFIGTRSVRAVRAARLRTDIRDLGMGDGYCGFQLPLPSKESTSGHAIVEVRERRFGRVIGRVVIGEDGSEMTKDVRLTSAAHALSAANNALDTLSTQLRARATPLEELGATLSRLSRGPNPSSLSPHKGVFAACEDRLAVVPTTELGGYAAPRLSLVIRTSRGEDVQVLAAALREITHAMRHVGTELILLDDGSVPLAVLLPARLQNLRLVRSPPNTPPGVGLNAAALSARGRWLAFGRSETLGSAQLLEAVSDAAEGSIYVEALDVDSPAEFRYHRLLGLIMRETFNEMGGFDPQLEEPELWVDLLHKADVLNQRVIRWKYERRDTIGAARTGSAYHG